jgi:hypothetical protein
VLELRTDIAGEARPKESDTGLRGEQLAVVSRAEEGRWPLGLRVLIVAGLGALAWLAVIFLPGLLNDLLGFLLGLLLQAVA